MAHRRTVTVTVTVTMTVTMTVTTEAHTSARKQMGSPGQRALGASIEVHTHD